MTAVTRKGKASSNSTNDAVAIPKTMSDCLLYDDPIAALQLLADASAKLATEKSIQLKSIIEDTSIDLPEILSSINPNHPIFTAKACADSINSSLSKIASGGSQASQEIRKLETEKRETEEHASAVETALMLRKNSDRAAQSFQARAWQDAAEAIRPWLTWKEIDNPDPRVRLYAGEHSIQQFSITYENLKNTLLGQYESSVQKGDLQSLVQLTPILSIIQLEHDGLKLYLQFLSNILENSFQDALKEDSGKDTGPVAPFILMARVYNAAVTALRHHLPMVSQCLHKAEGAAAVIKLVHEKVENVVLPIISKYQRDRQLLKVSYSASQIYALIEETYTGRVVGDSTSYNDEDDCGFSTSIGTLHDVNSAMEEVATCMQHAESYMRFLQHSCNEVNKARRIFFEQDLQQERLERDRQEWTKMQKSPIGEDRVFQDMSILPTPTPLVEAIAELGGQYVAIERCLLLASMQRSFSSFDTYRPVALNSDSRLNASSKALQTALVEACFFYARRAAQRAFATGHTGTASAMTNFCVECLRDVFMDVLKRRAESFGVSYLKPGEGMLAGSTNLFNNASNLIRQGTNVGNLPKDENVRRQKMEEEIAHACAKLNDLEVSIHHASSLETLLQEFVTKGFALGTHETEQLQLCVKSFGTVAESFRMASDSVIDSLESVLKSRVRSIVGDAVGSDGGTTTFMSASSVIGGGKGGDRITMRMNYNLDEESYNLLQVSETFVSRLCYLLDESLLPLKVHLSPRLWDKLLISCMGTACKRLEISLRKCSFTALGSIAFDADVRDLLHYTKENLISSEFSSNIVVTRECPPLSRLLQIAKLLSVDDLEDVVDLINSSKRKGNWDIKLADAKAFLCARQEFDAAKVNKLLRLPRDD